MSTSDDFDIDEELKHYLSTFEYYPKDAAQLMRHSSVRTGLKRRYSVVNQSLRQWIKDNSDSYNEHSPYKGDSSVSTGTVVLSGVMSSASSSQRSPTRSTYGSYSRAAAETTLRTDARSDWKTLDESDDWDWDKLWKDYIKKFGNKPMKAMHLWNHAKEKKLKCKYKEARAAFASLRLADATKDEIGDEDLDGDSSTRMRAAADSHSRTSSRRFAVTGHRGFIVKKTSESASKRRRIYEIDEEQFECFWAAYLHKFKLNPSKAKVLYNFVKDDYVPAPDKVKAHASVLYTYKSINVAFKKWSKRATKRLAHLLCKEKQRRQSLVHASALCDEVTGVVEDLVESTQPSVEEAESKVQVAAEKKEEDGDSECDSSLEPLETCGEPVADARKSGSNTPVIDTKRVEEYKERIGQLPIGKAEDSESEEEEEVGDDSVVAEDTDNGTVENATEKAEDSESEEEEIGDDSAVAEVSDIDNGTVENATENVDAESEEGEFESEGKREETDSESEVLSETGAEAAEAQVHDAEPELETEAVDTPMFDDSEEDGEEEIDTEEAVQRTADEDSEYESESMAFSDCDSAPNGEVLEKDTDAKSESEEGSEEMAAAVIQSGANIDHESFEILMHGYEAEFGKGPGTAQQLVAWANQNGHSVKFGAIRRAMTSFA